LDADQPVREAAAWRHLPDFEVVAGWIMSGKSAFYFLIRFRPDDLTEFAAAVNN
jgi:hypothetical protein